MSGDHAAASLDAFFLRLHELTQRFLEKRPRWVNASLRSRLRLASTFEEARRLAVEKRAYHVRMERGRLTALESRLKALEGAALPLVLEPSPQETS